MPVLAPLLLALSVGIRLAWTYVLPSGDTFVDLHVYVGGAATIGMPAQLYNFTYSENSPDFPLPFTYPPFAALVFYPLTLLPFGVIAFLWQIGVVAALYASVRVCQKLLASGGEPGRRETAMLWTAVGMWTEPVRATLDYGQVNVVLMLALLCAVYTNRWWLSGLLVGVAAGIKLTPAVSGLYLVGMRRWAAAAFSIVTFFATIGLAWLVLRGQAVYYFTDLLGDARRVGPIGTTTNQSWRGGISRILGHDAGFGPLVIVAIVATAAVALLAWRTLAADDRLGRIVVVMLFGLLLSPISWTHHWVWLIPLMIWLVHGEGRARPWGRALGWGWLAVTLVGPPWVLNFAQDSQWAISRPWYLAWAGLAYIVAAVATMTWIAASRPQSDRSRAPAPDPSR